MSGIEICGDRPGALNRVVELHDAYYTAVWGFDAAFAREIRRDMTAFLDRLDPARDGFWTAVSDGRAVGSVSIDAGAESEADARLRWFIVDPACHGHGVGRALLDTAMAFCCAADHRRVCLHTFAGLDAARHLYEAVGFRLVDEKNDDPWGLNVRFQIFEAKL